MGVNTNAPTAGAALDLSYNTNSVLLPTGTSGQRPTGVNGMLRYNTTLNAIEGFINSAWTAISGSAGSEITAWVRFDGTSCGGGTCTITKSLNVSSVTATATGEYDVAFSAAMADADYGVLVTCSAIPNTATFGSVDNASQATPLTTTDAHIACWKSPNQANTDVPYVTVAILGD